MSSNQKELTFPHLEPQDILSNLKDLEISCSLSDLQKPISGKIMKVFESFIILFLGENTFDNVSMGAPANGQSGLNLLHDSLHLLNFHKKLIQVCTCAGVELVTLRDVLAPKPKRTCYILSALINFCKFRDDKMLLFEECSNTTDSLLVKREKLSQKLSTLTDKVNEIRSSRKSEQPVVQELRKVTVVLATQLRELKKTQLILAQEMDTLKLEKSKISEKLTNNSFLIANLKQDCVRLQSRIVSDPEKLLQTIQEMNASVRTDKQNVFMAERKSRELKTRLEAMNAVEADLESTKALLVECDSLKMKQKESLQSLSQQKDLVARKENAAKDLEIKEQQLQRQSKQAHDKLDRLSSHQAQREEANIIRSKTLAKEYSIAKEKLDQAVSQKQDLTIATAAMLDEMRDYEKSVDTEVNQLQKSFNNLCSQISAYQHEVSLAMPSQV